MAVQERFINKTIEQQYGGGDLLKDQQLEVALIQRKL
jgi:hypothetical protein